MNTKLFSKLVKKATEAVDLTVVKEEAVDSSSSSEQSLELEKIAEAKASKLVLNHFVLPESDFLAIEDSDKEIDEIKRVTREEKTSEQLQAAIKGVIGKGSQ
jgi:hypothetical protein